MITIIEQWLGQKLPGAYRTFLENQPDDLFVGDLVVLYGQASFVERNETYEVKHFCPGHFTIGDDSGGQQVLLSFENEHVFLVDAGSMHPGFAELIAYRFSDWFASGCSLPDEDTL